MTVYKGTPRARMAMVFLHGKAVIFIIKLHTIPPNNQCLGGNTHI